MFTDEFKQNSYWMTTREYTPNAALRGRKKVDVAIIGGGFTGLSAAYHLKKDSPGMDVALLEGEVIGYGASGRNGGFSMTLFGLTLGMTALRFGKAKAREAHLYMERAVDHLRALIDEHRMDCDYEHPGFLRVATSEKYRRRILHEIELAHSLGLKGIEWMDRNQLEKEVRNPLYLGAWWEPRCGILNPAKLAWEWKRVIQEQKVQVFEQTPVVRIERSGGCVHLTTPWGHVEAKKVVLATNAYSHLIPMLKRKQVPVWTHIVLTEPLKESHFREIGWQNRQGIEDARNLVHYYRLTADNRLLMGGRDISLSYGTEMDRDRNETTFQGLENDVRELFPALQDVTFTHHWGGPVSVPMDMAPAIGYVGDKNIVYSLGCVGHAVSMTQLNGQTIADLVRERKSDLTDVFFVNRKTLPWPPEPVRFLVSKAILRYMQAEDRKYDVT